MIMTPRVRKFALTAHVTSSVGWLGAVVAYLALAIGGLTSDDAQVVGTAYRSMEVIGWCVILPSSLAALLTGLVQSLGTEWGLLRRYWVVTKLLLTVAASTVLLLRADAFFGSMSAVGAGSSLSSAEFGLLRVQLVVHAAAAVLVLLAATALSVYKPWGMTNYGRRKQQERREVSVADRPSRPGFISMRPGPKATTGTPRWVYVVGVHAVGLGLLFVVLHLTGNGVPGH